MGIATIKPDYDIINERFQVPATKSFGGGGCIKSNFISADDSKYHQVSDIEMITFEASPYTSLKDLMQKSSPSSPSSWMIMSPNNSNHNGSGRKDSWREIPIKDPLLQHAAWAYLMPMSSDADVTHSGNLMQKLKDSCGGVFGCLNDVVLVMIRAFFSQ